MRITSPSPAADRRAQHTYDVKDFGALGDGATNDTAAIQAGIAAAQANGGVVSFPQGSYVHTGLSITAQVTLRGDGTGVSTLLGPAGADNLALNVGGGARVFSIAIERLALGWLANQTVGYGIHVGNVGSLNLRDVAIGSASGGTPNVGVYVEDGAQCFLSGLRVTGCSSHGVQFAPLAGKDVVDFWFTDDCLINSNGGDGFRFRSDTTGIIEGIHLGACSVYNNTGNGITIYKNSTGAVKNFHIYGTIVDSNKGIGITADATAGQAITNLFLDWVACSANTHISVTPSGPFNDGCFIGAVQDWHIDGGNYSLSGKSAIQVNGASNGLIANVTCYDNNSGVNTALTAPTYGVNVAGTTQYLRIVNNQVYNETARSETIQNGIIIGASALDIEVYGNYLPHLGGATPFTDGAAATSRIQEWGNRTVGTNSDATFRARGLRVDTITGGGLRDTLRLVEPTNAKNFYMRCDASGNLQYVNSGFTAVIGGIDLNGHVFKQQAAVPTYVAGTGGGGSPTVFAMTGTDAGGTIKITTGTAPVAGGNVVVVTFQGTWTPVPSGIVISGQNDAAAALSGTQQVKPVMVNGTTWNLVAGTAGLTAATQYIWNWVAAA